MSIGINGWRVHGWTGAPRYLKNILAHWTPSQRATSGEHTLIYGKVAEDTIAATSA